MEYIDLSPDITGKEVDQIVARALSSNWHGIIVPPFWVKRAAREIGPSDIQLVTVVGFPLGYHMTETKIEETTRALTDGANEIDVVLNISAFKEGMPWVKIEVAKLSKLIHEHEAMMKVIIETAYLSTDEIEKATLIAKDAGTDFVKTSTGFAPAGAKVEDIRLMRSILPSNVGIKASGGIKTREDAISMIEAGADRIGTSSGVEIVKEP